MRLTAHRLAAALVVSVCMASTAAVLSPAWASPAHVQRQQPSCGNQNVPPPPVDSAEQPPAGKPAPAPLPVPERPVGGPRLGECDNVLPEKAASVPSQVNAASWIVADLDTGAVLAANDPHARHRPASAITVLTAMAAVQELDMDASVTVTKEDTEQEGDKIGLGAGGKYTVKQLLRGMLLVDSAVDAVSALSRQLGGTEATLSKMNALAAQIGALDTRVATASGRDGPGMSSSVYDIALMVRTAMRNENFSEITRARSANFPMTGSKSAFTITNDNKLLTSYSGAIGGKTGFTANAGNAVVGMASKSGRRLVTVLLRAEARPVATWQQAGKLLDYGFAMKSDVKPVGQLVERAPGTSSTPETPVQAVRDPNGEAVMDPSSAAPTAFGNVGGPLTISAGVLLVAALLIYLQKKRSRRSRA
ncbi:serine hydrolase [Allokutzneria sp. A3M-2-11 16]|uniref:D-alanyl-D-alanine carboxypeptidase family protein n=1 Tax=Allokutzneria sp. A3M-2-11 16 TaxID=2962043 RepID=UPI0020B7B22C|nr:serine hydrolase [Allokutzneria sp. A3M-2-11 16]MCP3800381.1 serine hydrolase [Allokutzneria sp. A3M-2-11 16]